MQLLTELFQELLKWCGLELHDYDRTPAPFHKKVAPPQPKPKQIQQDAKNVQRDIHERPWLIEEEEGEITAIEFTLLSEKEASRNKGVSREELEELATTDMKVTKYRELKKYWSIGYSAAKTARQFKGQYGYSVRTIEKYWAQYNRFKQELTEEEKK